MAEWFIRFENILGIIERRSTGVTVLDQLLLILPSAGIDPFTRLFNRCVNDAEEEPDRFKDVQVPFARRSQDIYVRYKKHFGFATSGSGITSRSELYSTTLQSAAKQVGDVVTDKITIDQILSLEIRNGRVDHPRGEHDDMVIAFLLGFWWLTQGKNLSFYGLDISKVLYKARQRSMKNVLGDYDFYYQEKVRKELEMILEKIKNESNELILHKLEQQARFIGSKIGHHENETLTIEELIKQSKDQRKATKINNYMNGNQRYQSVDTYYNDPRLVAQSYYDPTRGQIY